MRGKRYWWFGLFLLGLVAGCTSGNMGSVSGTVTLDGKPLPNATVEFQPVDGTRPSYGVTDENGYYTLSYTHSQSGAEVGKHKVKISTGGEDEDEQGNAIIIPEKVPAKYNYSSELIREVKPGSNTIDFQLDSNGPIYDPAKDIDQGIDDCC